MFRSAAAAALALACAFGASGCLRARGTDQEPVVVGFRIEGVRAVSEDDLKSKLATQASGRFAWNEALRLDPDALDADRRRIQAYYRERGYYEARVEDPQIVPKGRGRAVVILRVVEGRPTRVTKVTVNGLEAAPEAEQRMGGLPLKPGDVFTAAAYDGARDGIYSTLHSNGWADGSVEPHATVDPDSATAEVTYDVEPGRRWKFGPIQVSGIRTRVVPHVRIREQVLGAFKPGEWFDEAKLDQARDRVFALGVFGGVRIARGNPDPQAGTIPIVVNVSQAPFRTIRMGPGLGLQAIRWDAHGAFSWQHRNYYGELRRVSTEARLGYAWLPSPFRPTKSGTVGLVALDFSQPGVLTRYVDTSARLEVEKGIEQAYDFYSQRLRVGLPLRLTSRRWTFAPSYNLEVYELSNYGANLDLTAPQTVPLLENCPSSVCLLSYLEQRIAWDGRDDPVNTRRGLYLAFAVQEGFDVGSYGYQYLRFLPELRFFLPLGGAVLATRARVGALVPVNETGDPPLPARFKGGGPLSMRGYSTGRLAKMVRRGNEWVPLGGNGLADGSLELRFGITRSLGGAIFLDAGNVSDASAVPTTWRTVLDPTLLQLAAGVGLRYRTPVGPLRLDIAARLPERISPLTNESFPSVPFTTWPDGTPHREPIVAVHFSIGEAF